MTVALNHEKTGGHPERITKVNSLTNKYNWEGMNYPKKQQ